MSMRLIAVGTRMPGWVRSAYDDYVTRLGSASKLTLVEIEPAARGASRDPARAVAAEARLILGKLRSDDYVVSLDERGTQMSSRQLAVWLESRRQEGADLTFLIGGPDGLAA